VIGPEGGAWSEGAAGVDVLVMSSSDVGSIGCIVGGVDNGIGRDICWGISCGVCWIIG
jgi:hypothetical protein